MKGYEPPVSLNAFLFTQRFLQHSRQSTPKRIRSLQPKQDQQKGPKMQQLKNPEARETSVLQQKRWYHLQNGSTVSSHLRHLDCYQYGIA